MALAMPQQPFPFVMVLTSIDRSPPIHIQPPAAQRASGAPTKQSAPTPATPGFAAGASPDAGAPTPAPTPSDAVSAEIAADPDAHLVDATDETWGLILAHRLNLRATATEYYQSLSSGLLVKLPPRTPTESPFAIGAGAVRADTVGRVAVHLLWAHNNSAKSQEQQQQQRGGGEWGHSSSVSKPHADGVLREYLGHFRNLALLAKVRGLDDGRAGLLPWHILVVVRAVEGLDAVYGTERWSTIGG
jgi:mediator of RNA polymerase II transcription subunit 13